MPTSSSPPDGPPTGDPPLSPGYRALLASERVNARLRQALVERSRPVGAPAGPQALGEAEFATLQALVRRIVPQPAGAADLAARIDARLASGNGDGWRFAVLPADREAYGRALRTLDAAARGRHAKGVAELSGEAVDTLLRAIEARALPAGPSAELDADGLLHWFEDLRADAVQAYMALPSTLDRIGFSGVGAGGDGSALHGFARFGIGVEEDWEPRAHPTGDAP